MRGAPILRPRCRGSQNQCTPPGQRRGACSRQGGPIRSGPRHPDLFAPARPAPRQAEAEPDIAILCPVARARAFAAFQADERMWPPPAGLVSGCLAQFGAPYRAQGWRR
jgi:hypothetical protein